MTGPYFVPTYRMPTTGVDFLGLRQANLDLMSDCLPGFNNTTRFVRAFSLLAWIHWKFWSLAQARGDMTSSRDVLEAYRDKIELLFTWGHLEHGIRGLPGRNAKPPATDDVPLTFSAWNRSRTNTSLMAAVQYGPASKTLSGFGFLEPREGGVFRACGTGVALAQALDSSLCGADGRLPAVLGLDTVNASVDQASELLPRWSIETPSQAERLAFRAEFFDPSSVGGTGDLARRSATVELIRRASESSGGEASEVAIRKAMTYSLDVAEGPLLLAQRRWVVLQVRQLQRLAFECLHAWLERRVDRGARDTRALAEQASAALADAGVADNNEILRVSIGRLGLDRKTLSGWMERAAIDSNICCIDLRPTLIKMLDGGDGGFVGAFRALLLCAAVTDLLVAEGHAERSRLDRGRAERISLLHWSGTVRRHAETPVPAFVRYLLEVCVLSQHFAVAAGRFDGERQRLRVTIEEEGLEMLATKPWEPAVTADRLGSALSLMRDCGILETELPLAAPEVDGIETDW